MIYHIIEDMHGYTSVYKNDFLLASGLTPIDQGRVVLLTHIKTGDVIYIRWADGNRVMVLHDDRIKSDGNVRLDSHGFHSSGGI